jgi:hypothetical protein
MEGNMTDENMASFDKVPEDVLDCIDRILALTVDDRSLRSTSEELKKLLCDKYGIKKYCGGVVA